MKKCLLVTFFSYMPLSLRQISSLIKKEYDVSYLTIHDSDLFQFKFKDKKKLFNFISKFDYILFSSNIYTKEISFKLISEIKKINKDITIIIGGALGITESNMCLKYADYVCIWEAYNILKLLSFIEKKLKTLPKNFISKKHRDINYDITEVNKLPTPDYENKNNYFLLNHKFIHNPTYFPNEIYIESVRGCLYDCSFCSSSYFNKIRLKNKKEKLVFRSIKKVIEDIYIIKKNGGKKCKRIQIIDDNFFFNSLEDIRYFVSEYNKKINLPIHLDVDIRTKDYLKKFKEFIKIKNKIDFRIGVQTGSEKFNLKIYNRPQKNSITISRNKKMFELIDDKKRIRIRYYIIYNNPLETKNDVIKTINLVLSLKQPIIFFSYTPLPLTLLGEKVKNRKNNVNNFHNPVYDSFSRHSFYYIYLFYINFMRQNNLSFMLPRKFKSNLFFEILNKKIVGIFYIRKIAKRTAKKINISKKIQSTQILDYSSRN